MTIPIPTQIMTALATRLATITTTNGYHTTLGAIRVNAPAEEPQPSDTFPIVSLFALADEPSGRLYEYRRTMQLEVLAVTSTALDDILDDVRRCLLQLPTTRWLPDTLEVEDPEIGAAIFEPHLGGSDYHALTLALSVLYTYNPE